VRAKPLGFSAAASERKQPSSEFRARILASLGIFLHIPKIPHFGHQEFQKGVFGLTHHKTIMRNM
jgi:hypothetical protein